jgi:hypothetical protein
MKLRHGRILEWPLNRRAPRFHAAATGRLYERRPDSGIGINVDHRRKARNDDRNANSASLPALPFRKGKRQSVATLPNKE